MNKEQYKRSTGDTIFGLVVCLLSTPFLILAIVCIIIAVEDREIGQTAFLAALLWTSLGGVGFWYGLRKIKRGSQRRAFLNSTQIRSERDQRRALKYKGVGGWLLLLCAGLVILSPIRTLWQIRSGWSFFLPFFDQSLYLRTVMLIDSAVSIVLAIFGMNAGFNLWTVKPGAVKLTKKYFLVVIGYNVLSGLSLLLISWPPQVKTAFQSAAIVGSAASVLSVCVWYSYLNKSKRVWATYEATEDKLKPSESPRPVSP